MRLLVTGASGFIGSHVCAQAVARGHQVTGTYATRPFHRAGVDALPMSLTERAQIADVVARARPEAVVHLAAVSRPDECAANPVQALDVNVRSLDALLPPLLDLGAHLVFASSDLVFEGEAAPYREEAATEPLGVYGQSKALGERRLIFQDGLSGAIARIALTYGFGLGGAHSFAAEWLRRLRAGEQLRAFADERRAVVYVEDVADVLVTLCEQRAGGIFHLAGPASVSRFEFARALCEAFDLDPAGVVETLAREAALREPRPRDVTLDISGTIAALPYAPRALRAGLAAMRDAERAPAP